MEKIKGFLESDQSKSLLAGLLIILVGLASFGLGRLSSNQNPGLSINYKGPVITSPEVVTSPNPTLIAPKSEPKKKAQIYFASSRGSKYYHPGCSGGKNLKEENKIFFESEDEARRAGYELSSTCR